MLPGTSATCITGRSRIVRTRKCRHGESAPTAFPEVLDQNIPYGATRYLTRRMYSSLDLHGHGSSAEVGLIIRLTGKKAKKHGSYAHRGKYLVLTGNYNARGNPRTIVHSTIEELLYSRSNSPNPVRAPWWACTRSRFIPIGEWLEGPKDLPPERRLKLCATHVARRGRQNPVHSFCFFKPSINEWPPINKNKTPTQTGFPARRKNYTIYIS